MSWYEQNANANQYAIQQLRPPRPVCCGQDKSNCQHHDRFETNRDDDGSFALLCRCCKAIGSGKTVTTTTLEWKK